MKKTLIRAILRAAINIFGQVTVERLLVFGCRKPIIRKIFRLGTLAYEFPNFLTTEGLRLATLRHGYQLYVTLFELPGISSYFFGFSDTLPLFDLVLEKGDVFVDAGANRGQYTFLAASLVTSAGRVVAFEPNPRLFEILQQSVRTNNWGHFVTIENRALWDQQDEEMKFYLSTNPHRSGTSSLIFHGYDIAEDTYTTVKTETLDAYLNRHQIAVCHALKIDVERAEDHVLLGTAEYLKQHKIKYILIEMYCHSSAHELLTQWGYVGYLVQKGAGVIDIRHISENRFSDCVFVSPQEVNNFVPKIPELHARLKRL